MSRSGFYRYLQHEQPKEEDLLLRERLQQLAVAHGRKCGYRRLTALLRREGYLANKKRVLRLMQEDNLLSLRKARYVLTTDSHHDLPVYPNLTRRLTLTGLNQLWIADITYIRLRSEFVFLAVVLDAHSRRVIGWELGRNLHAELALKALRMALQERTWQPGVLIHHSDRGVQYASREYTSLLVEHETRVSMSRRGSPYENASCESFMKTLKHEEIYANDYCDLDHLRANIEDFVERYYNRCRLHSALGYRPPEEFEQAAALDGISAGATMSFFRHEEIYRSDGRSLTDGKPTEAGSPDHRFDESPAGYSLAGWAASSRSTRFF